MEKLALLGGQPVITEKCPEDLFKWPIYTKEEDDAVLDVVHNNKFSGTDITIKFQDEFAKWQGRKYALAFTNGTMSLAAAMFSLGLGAGDEMICTAKTYWATAAPAQWLGISLVFCNINGMMSMDPNDLERCITPRTRAIMVVHYFGYPCDMDAIMAIAKKHNLYVIEDVSHAQGGLYHGRKLGTFGDVSAMSLMSYKSFACGEMGILVTDERRFYERAIAYGHYERNNENNIIESEDLKPYYHIALGGVKGRVNQVCSAIGLIQLKYYDERTAEIRKAMNYFWDKLEGVPGIVPLRVDESTGSNMAGFYAAHGVYRSEELEGLSVKRFVEAVNAEMNGQFVSYEGGNYCLNTHPYFQTFDALHLGKPSRIAFSDRDVRQDDKALARSEDIDCYMVPWFKKFRPEWIDLFAQAYRKVALNYKQLLPGDTHRKAGGRWYGNENEAIQEKKD
ncbi:MAG: aminotransferase class V-fold PLP-dependent enzyme [Clostridia bacterium]|nr:aminotransferase class V-fold PLP-dependent enzyme [Clostridia bacterium]